MPIAFKMQGSIFFENGVSSMGRNLPNSIPLNKYVNDNLSQQQPVKESADRNGALPYTTYFK